MDQETAKIINIIDKIRPFLVDDGGDIEFVKYEDNIVYVKLLGACAGCSLIDVTLKEGIEQFIINEVPTVKEVRNINSEANQY
ncbi:MAG: NifU family protein [Bacilli bacterium]|nr:NifU family protein [Bacilli bacterium]MBQ3469094.1 NifU family protein [Bacilli bacterium]